MEAEKEILKESRNNHNLDFFHKMSKGRKEKFHKKIEVEFFCSKKHCQVNLGKKYRKAIANVQKPIAAPWRVAELVADGCYPSGILLERKRDERR